MIKGLLIMFGGLLFMRDRIPYKKIIKRWSSLFHMKVRYHNRYSEHFSVDVIENILYISRFNKAVHSKQEYFASVAHEFGHLIDYAYKEFYFDEEQMYHKLTDKDAIYRDEVVAWKIAKILLTDAGEYDEKFFKELSERCLKEYRVALKIETKKKKRKTKGKKKSAKKSKGTKRKTTKLP